MGCQQDAYDNKTMVSKCNSYCLVYSQHYVINDHAQTRGNLESGSVFNIGAYLRSPEPSAADPACLTPGETEGCGDWGVLEDKPVCGVREKKIVQGHQRRAGEKRGCLGQSDVEGCRSAVRACWPGQDKDTGTILTSWFLPCVTITSWLHHVMGECVDVCVCVGGVAE